MASIDLLGPLQTAVETPKQDAQLSNPVESGDSSSAPSVAANLPSASQPASASAIVLPENSKGTVTGKPTIVQLGHPSAPQPKKFSAVNINKTFLQKNSTTSTSSPTPSASASKPANSVGT